LNYGCIDEWSLRKNQHRKQVNSAKYAWCCFFYCKSSVCLCVCLYMSVLTYTYIQRHMMLYVRCIERKK